MLNTPGLQFGAFLEIIDALEARLGISLPFSLLLIPVIKEDTKLGSHHQSTAHLGNPSRERRSQTRHWAPNSGKNSEFRVDF